MSADTTPMPGSTAQIAMAQSDELLATASKVRGGGWSLENLLDAIFLATSASVILQQEIVRQNADLLSSGSAGRQI